MFCILSAAASWAAPRDCDIFLLVSSSYIEGKRALSFQ